MLALALKVFITPLGLPVVPPVYARAETSSGPTSGPTRRLGSKASLSFMRSSPTSLGP